MPLSIAPILKREQSMAGTRARQIFPESANMAAPVISRAVYQGSSRVDDVILGGQSRAGIGISSGGGPHAFRTSEAYDNNLVFGPLPGRATAETRLDSGDSTMTGGATAPSQSHESRLPVTNMHDASRAEASIFRAAAVGAGFESIRHSGAGVSLQGWLPLHQGGLSSGIVARARSPIQLSSGRPAGIRAALGDPLLDGATSSRAVRSTETAPDVLLRTATAGEAFDFHSAPAGLAPVLLPMRFGALTAPPLMRRSDVPVRHELHAPAPATQSVSLDLPLAAPTIRRDERSSAVLHRSNGTSLQAASREAASAASRALPIGAGAEIPVVEAPAAAAKPQIDLDELVEKAWQKLMRKLTIEQERRGYSRWL